MDIVHRDIKLENVVLADRDSLRTVVIDFGLSEYAWEEDHLFVRCGTPGYISP
jgi:serine/threonine protein kinase